VPPSQSGTTAATFRQRLVHVAIAQRPRDVRKARAEDEGGNAPPVTRKRMKEVQEHARVAVHGSGDVAEHDERRRAVHARTPGEAQRVAALARHPPQGPRQVERASRGMRAIAARPLERHRERHRRDQPFRGIPFLGRHALEIDGLQPLGEREGERRVDDDLVVRRGRRMQVGGGRHHRLAHPTRIQGRA
jgi:hypothetical protein